MKRSGRPSPLHVALGDAHARVAVGDAVGLRLVDEVEAERPAGLVDVEVVRVLVVGDVEIGAAVAVHVGEDRAETVAEVRRLEPGLDADLLEASTTVGSVALVEEEEVAHALVVVREARDRVRDRVGHVRVAGDEDVRPAVAVHVRDRGARVPAVRRGERARSLKVPLPLFQRMSTPVAVVTTRSV